MRNKLYGFFVLVLSVLTVPLVTDAITSYLMKYKGMAHPLKFTLLGMGITVLILYPSFKYLDRLITRFTAKVLLKGKGFAGIVFMFCICFGVLFWFYVRKWFGIDALDYLWQMIKR